MSTFKKGDVIGYTRNGYTWIYVVVVLNLIVKTDNLEEYKVFALSRPYEPPGIINRFTYHFNYTEDYVLIAKWD